jgi:hypothetical protein
MPATKYTYSISGDFPNQLVDIDRLTREIRQSVIVIALDYINTSGDDCDIWFKDALSGGDETVLDGIVAAHSGDPLPDAALPVSISYAEMTVVDGYTSTASTAFVAVMATTYTQQTSNAQRSLVSSSTNDASAGTGARKVRVTYFDEDLAGPFVETVTMNGTTPVNTVATNICFIERMDVVEVGSQASNIGTISLKATTAGGGATVGSIAAGDGETNWCHHYVGVGQVAKLAAVFGNIKGVVNGELHLRSSTPTVANTPETTVAPVLLCPPGQQSTISFEIPLTIDGPRRLTLYARPKTSDALDWLCGFNYYTEDA